ncbi:Crp/Fnr family transcriptional regulator [Empedobacter brevis]|uniref:Crp/Fnr family transcriptional regulator n=1 Tax=Empedobacter brevis TaxID=247 RepID=UPI0028B0C710|nr:Crp/Fnr family transcriptional regulator [Empedobacter brevis]
MIKNYFKSFNIFTENELNDLIQHFVPKRLTKSDFFVKEGEQCKEIAFVLSGIFRSYYTTENGVENTFCFRFPHHLLAPYSAFITGNASMETIEAVSDVNLLVIPKKKIDELVNENPKWTKVLKLIAEQEYLELEKRFFQLQKDTATERYISLLKDNPNYIQEIPLHYLASYLGVTQRHLSRIRKERSF